MRNSVGEWLYDQEILKSHVSDFFQTLSQSEGRVEANFSWSIDLHLRRLQDEACVELMKPVSSSEIFRALKCLKPLKSPDPDGLHLIFFQKNFHIVSKSLIDFVTSIFNGEDFPVGTSLR